MSRMSRVLSLLFAMFVIVGLFAADLTISAQDKKDKKDDKKKEVKDKKDDKDKKEVKDKKDDKDKKEEKKEPFKADPAQQEFAYILKTDKDETGKTFWVLNVAFGADGKTVAATYRDNTVKVWDLGAKKDTVSIKAPELKGIGGYSSLIYANDQLFVGSGKLIKRDKAKDKEKDKEKDKVAKDKEKDKVVVKELPFREGEIKIFDAKSGKPGKSLFGHDLNIDALAISKDGKQLASGSEDGTVKIWDIAGSKNTQTIKAHADAVTGVGFSPDAKQVVTTSMDRTVRVFDIAGAKEIASFKVEREVETKDAKGKVTKAKESGRDFTKAVFTNDGKKVIAASRDGVIKIYDVEGKKELKEIKAPDGILAMAVNADGSKIATGGYDQSIKIWDADGKDMRTIKAHLGNVLTLSFSPNSQLLASGGTDGLIKIWALK
jgi:WD40 repeat protein